MTVGNEFDGVKPTPRGQPKAEFGDQSSTTIWTSSWDPIIYPISWQIEHCSTTFCTKGGTQIQSQWFYLHFPICSNFKRSACAYDRSILRHAT